MRRWLPWACLFLVLTGAGAVYAIRRTADDELFRLSRRRGEILREVTAAAALDVARWSPEAWTALESTRRTAVASVYRAGTAVLWPFGDIAAADRDLDALRAAALEAADAARHRAAEAQVAAAEAIAGAEQSVSRVTRLAPFLHLAAGQRTRASRSRLVLDEARRHERSGEFELALARAESAQALADQVGAKVAVAAGRYTDAAQLREWTTWVQETVSWSRRTGGAAIVVSKADHRLTLYHGGRVTARYTVDLSPNWTARKAVAGDGAIPEGRYRIVAKKARGATAYYKALLLDYPNAEDRRVFAAARRAGAVSRTASIGGLIEIHGEGGRGIDWTRGCVALTNAEMDALFSRVANATPVTIVGAEGPTSAQQLLGEVRALEVEE